MTMMMCHHHYYLKKQHNFSKVHSFLRDYKAYLHEWVYYWKKEKRPKESFVHINSFREFGGGELFEKNEADKTCLVDS